MLDARFRWLAIGAVSLSCAAIAMADVAQNGTDLNGTDLNGTDLNGTDLNGTTLKGISFGGGTLDGASLLDLHLEQAQLVARNGEGIRLAGTSLVGAELAGQLDNGATLALQITSVSQGPSPNDDIYHYGVSYRGGDGRPRALCIDRDGNPIAAIALAGRWNYGQGMPGGGSHIDDPASFTFACRDGALGKCTEWGYKRWRTENGVSLAGYHQTCTRVVRADYCGDGATHTVNGQLINIYDNQGVQKDTRLWLGEASWDEHGARAYNLLNRSHLDLIYRLNCDVPIRLLFDANWEFAHGAKIITETPLSSDL
jgi:hypothetical protein